MVVDRASGGPPQVQFIVEDDAADHIGLLCSGPGGPPATCSGTEPDPAQRNGSDRNLEV